MKAMSTRGERVAEQLRQIVAQLLRRGDFIDDDLAKLLEVPFVWVSADLRNARIYFTLLSGEYDSAEIRDITKYLNSICFQLQKEMNKGMHLKHTPKMHFMYDKDAARKDRVEEIFRKVEGENKTGVER